jgi:flagellar hook-basal body complex protein FliE
MIEGIGPLGPARGPAGAASLGGVGKVEGERSFKEILQDSIESVNNLQGEADRVLEKFTRGEASEDQLMIAFKKAQIAFEAMLQIRNKLVAAFEEIQRMRI